MSPSATIYIRTDARPVTLISTFAALKVAFGRKLLTIEPRPLMRKSQTRLFGDDNPKPGEVDLILQPAS